MFFKRIFLPLLVLVLLAAAYFAVVLNWSYSSGERAGWIQKLSYKGWICKTWEGEVALVSLPGTSSVEKFIFTVRDPKVAADLNAVMGRRVTLHYEQKVGLPTSCFGETRNYVTGVSIANDISISPGVVVQTPEGRAADVAASASAAASAP